MILTSWAVRSLVERWLLPRIHNLIGWDKVRRSVVLFFDAEKSHKLAGLPDRSKTSAMDQMCSTCQWMVKSMFLSLLPRRYKSSWFCMSQHWLHRRTALVCSDGRHYSPDRMVQVDGCIQQLVCPFITIFSPKQRKIEPTDWQSRLWSCKGTKLKCPNASALADILYQTVWHLAFELFLSLYFSFIFSFFLSFFFFFLG